MNKLLTFSTVFIALFSFTACVPSGDPLTETFEATTEETKRIEIDLSSSDLEIELYEGDTVTIEYLTYERGPELTVREGKILRIKENNDLPFFINFDHSPKLFIQLPATYIKDLSINTSSGNVDLMDLSLENLNVQLSSGDLYMNKLTTEDIDVDLSSGDLIIDTATAKRLTIKTSSGHVDLLDVNAEVSGRSSSGDVTIEMMAINNDFTYDLSSGSLKMLLEDTPDNARFDLSCSSGDIHLDFDLDDYDRNEDDKIRGQIGDGDVEIEIDTSSGDIEIF